MEEPMKVARTILLTALLLATASAVRAAEATAPAPGVAPQSQAPASEFLAGELFGAPASDCGTFVDPMRGSGGQDPIPAAQICGSCSTPNCSGAIRGQICSLGSGQGFGNCNIYSGGFRCPTGGWECQCGSGPLP
jgi:hypothetical protein